MCLPDKVHFIKCHDISPYGTQTIQIALWQFEDFWSWNLWLFIVVLSLILAQDPKLVSKNCF